MRSASATASPWFPVDDVTTPRASASGDRERILFNAPRILNEPVRWRFSHLYHAAAPSARAGATGVRRSYGARRAAARKIADWSVVMAAVGMPGRYTRTSAPY